MLIPSRRHTKADLELWAELEAADLVHAQRPAMLRHIERSLGAIREFAEAGPCYASVSWGKDSTVLADLIRTASPDVSLVHIAAMPVGNPESANVKEAYLSRHRHAYHEAIVDYRAIPTGLAFGEIERHKDRLFFAAFRAAEQRFGNRHISGIRADESAGRKKRMRRWGLASNNALAPLGWWTQQDVFAYLALHGLPVHPSYAMLGGGRWDRRHIRVDELAGERGTGMGRRDWEQEYYGDVLRRLDARRP